MSEELISFSSLFMYMNKLHMSFVLSASVAFTVNLTLSQVYLKSRIPLENFSNINNWKQENPNTMKGQQNVLLVSISISLCFELYVLLHFYMCSMLPKSIWNL